MPESIKKKKMRVSNPPMPLIDKVTMGPFEKYVKYNKFPFKMVVHILLSLVITGQVFLLINYNAFYSETVMRRLFTLFFDEEMELDGVDYIREQYFYDIDSVREQVNTMIENYSELEDMDNIEKYNLVRVLDDNDDEIIAPIIMTPFFIRTESRNKWDKFSYNISSADRGPFEENISDESFRDFMADLTNFQMVLEVQHNIPTTKFTTFD